MKRMTRTVNARKYKSLRRMLRRAATALFAAVLIASAIPVAQVLAVGEEIVFDLYQGSVVISASAYSGYNSTGAQITGTHVDTNRYKVIQSNTDTAVEHNITLVGGSTAPTFDLTIDGLKCDTTFNQANGGIYAGFVAGENRNINLHVIGTNSIGRIHYSSGSVNDIDNSLTNTSLSIDGSGTLNTVSSYAWSAAIGGTDNHDCAANITISGSVTVNANGIMSSAIGGGGNGNSSVTISGGIVTASNNGPGATIGGGGGQSQRGGVGDVTITGGTVTAANSGTGVAIGGGGSANVIGDSGNVTISGGQVNATSASGNGIGGGNSVSAAGGSATVGVSGGTIVTNSIGGGFGAGGYSPSTITVTGGSLNTSRDITPTNGTASLTKYVITTALGANAAITSISASSSITYGLTDVKTDANQKVYLWLPADLGTITLNGAAAVTAPSAYITGAGADNTAHSGDTLTAAVSNPPTNPTYSYQWQKDTGSGFTDISGATGLTYVAVSDTIDYELRVAVTVNGTVYYSSYILVCLSFGYTVTIPESVSIASSGSFNLTAKLTKFTTSQSLTITVASSGGYTLSLTGATPAVTLSYALYKNSAHTQQITAGNSTAATLSQNGNNTATVYYAVSPPVYAGVYTDTLTFTVTLNE